MASPFTFSVTKPLSGDALNAFPAFVQGQWAALATVGAAGGVLGTLVPFGTATSGWRVVQDANVIWVVSNAYLSGHAGTWAQDDNSIDSYGYTIDPTTANSIRMLYMEAGDTTWSVIAEFAVPAGVSDPVNYLQFLASATGIATAITAVGADAAVDINLAPKGAGLVRIGGTAIGPANYVKATSVTAQTHAGTAFVSTGFTVAITPNKTGNVRVQVTACLSNGTNGDSCSIGIYYGTAAAPSANSAVTGTGPVGATSAVISPTGGQYFLHSIEAEITGLTLGTVYNIYVAYAAPAGGTATWISGTDGAAAAPTAMLEAWEI